MKTSKTPKNTGPNAHSSNSFFNKNGEGSFFSPNQASEKPFFQACPIQAKLTIGSPNDKYEQEADQVADNVMRMPVDGEQHAYGGGEPSVKSRPLAVSPVRPMRSELEEEQNSGISLIQKKQSRAVNHGQSSVPDAVVSAIHSLESGSPLSESVRARIEPVLGADLSDVRVKTDSQSQLAARDIHAKAFTHGNNIFLRAGQSQDDLRLMAHEATHTVQQRGAKAIQRSPIDTHFGRFNDDYYATVRTRRRHNDRVGLQMVMSFRPNEQVNASKIGFVQTARTISRGNVLIRETDLRTRERGEHILITNQSRSITSADAQPTDQSIFPTDEGTSIDQFPHRINPLYVVGNQQVVNGSARLETGEIEERIARLSRERIRQLREQQRTTGVEFSGYGNHGSREGADDEPTVARMADSPGTVQHSNSEQLFETTALAIEGEQAGTYYGSVRWGWRTDSQERFTKLPMTLGSMGAPSDTFLAAAQIWNRGQDSRGRLNIPLPVPDVDVVSRNRIAFYRHSHDDILDIGPIGYLVPGTRIERIGEPDDLMLRIRVVDCPPPLSGYIDSFDNGITQNSNGSVVTLSTTTQLYRHPQDIALGIDPIGSLESGQVLRIVNSGPLTALVRTDSCPLMGQTGYIDNFSSNPTLSDERALPTAEGLPYSGAILPQHVVQGRLADCYLLASLASLSRTTAGQAWLRDSVRELGRARYNIRLYRSEEGSTDLQERWIRVGPITSTHAGAREREGGEQNDSRWVQAIESAYSELRGDGSLISIGRTGPNGGGRAFGGARAALGDISGLNAERYRINENANADELWNRLQQAFAERHPLVTGTGSRENPSLGIYGGHNYSLISITEREGERYVRLRTPWVNRFRSDDRPAGVSNHPEFEITYAQFMSYYIQVDIGAVTGSRSASCPVPTSTTAPDTIMPTQAPVIQREAIEQTPTQQSGTSGSAFNDRLLVLRAALAENIRLAQGVATSQSQLEQLRGLEGRIPIMQETELRTRLASMRAIAQTARTSALSSSIRLLPRSNPPTLDPAVLTTVRSEYLEQSRGHQLFLLFRYLGQNSSPAAQEINRMLQQLGMTLSEINWRANPTMAAHAAAVTSITSQPPITILLGQAMLILLNTGRFVDMETVLLEEVYHAWDRLNESTRPRLAAAEMRALAQNAQVDSDTTTDAINFVRSRIETELYADLVQLSSLHRRQHQRGMSAGVYTSRGFSSVSNDPGYLERTLSYRVADLRRYLGQERGERVAQQIISRAEGESSVAPAVVDLLRELVQTEFR